MTKKYKKQVRMTKKVQAFILEKIYAGHDCKEITKLWPEDVPAYETIIRYSMNNEEFRKKYEDAYTVLLTRRLDELNEVADENWCRDRLAQYDGDYKLAFEARRAKLDALKFTLGKMAPILSKRFDKAQKVEVEHANAPQLAVVNYYMEPKVPQSSVDSRTHLLDNQPVVIEHKE